MKRFIFILLISLLQSVLHAQDNPQPKAISASGGGELYPNMSIKSIMTPTGWGSAGTFVFAGLAGSTPTPYRQRSDLVAGAGLAVGNSMKFISLAGILNVNDVSTLKKYSASFIASRHIGRGSSVSAGGLHLFVEKSKTDPGPSFYIVFSHAVQKSPSKNFMVSWLNYSIGVGNGRFYNKSPADFASGKGLHGTAVFGNISYEAFKNFNINFEWTGLNIALGTAWRPSYKFPAIGIGVADITGLSGTPRFIFSVGHAVMLTNNR